MSWRNIRLIFHREVGDQLRDRRTLFMVVILPLLLYPSLGIGMLQMSLLFSEQPRTVVILGADYLPQPDLLNPQGNRILDRWFANPHDSTTLKVITDKKASIPTTPPVPPDSTTPTEQATEQVDDQTANQSGTETPANEAENSGSAPESPIATPLEEQESLYYANEIQKRLTQISQVQEDFLNLKPDKEAGQQAEMKNQIERLRKEIAQLFAISQIDVLVIFPEGFADYVAQENARLVNRDTTAPLKRLSATTIGNTANEVSEIAYGRVTRAIDSWEQAILNERLQQANLPANLTSPINMDRIDLAQNDELAANVWSKLFPAMLVVMAMTGAFYPAVDLGAGEKERGTMETLLICPALRSEIVLGKFLTVLLFSLVTALLNLVSMGITGLYMLNTAGAGAEFAGLGDANIPAAGQLLWVGIMAVPLAALFAALSLSFALFAKSSKEGQYYLTPLLTITLGLTVFCISPAVEITPFYSFMPVMGPALLLKSMLLSGGSAIGLYWYIAPVLITSCLYSAFALMWAIDQFQREEVLFRESERFSLSIWFRHLLRDKEATPSFSESLFCFVLIMLLQFALLKTFGSALSGAAPDQQGATMVQLLIVQQLVIIACPALFMGLLLTSSVVRTFQFYTARPKFWLYGLLLPLMLHPVSLELQTQLEWFFPNLPEHAQAALATLSDGNLSIWLILFAFAVMPAVCEELAFRGFILSGFRHRGRDSWAILFSGLLFGIMHMIPQQVFNASLLGLVLGLLAIKSGSIFPCMLFHFVNNTLGVLHGNLGALREQSEFVRMVTVQGTGHVHYPLWLVGIATLLSAWCLYKLAQNPTIRRDPVNV